MTEVFDLDAVAREAAGEPFPFTFGGERYELPPHMDIRAVALLDAGHLHDALRVMLGNEQWQRMIDADATFNDVAFQALIEQYANHVGITVGESPASTGSSSSTGRPSKRTSNGSTVSRSQT